MIFFFDAELRYHSLHGRLDAASVQRRFNQMRIFEAPLPVWKEKTGMPMNGPEIS
jgi:hypothetical protein